jgi:hypothetical protein
MEFMCCVSVDCITGGGKHVDMFISFIKHFMETSLPFLHEPPQVVYYYHLRVHHPGTLLFKFSPLCTAILYVLETC